jgi:hypothetical protein
MTQRKFNDLEVGMIQGFNNEPLYLFGRNGINCRSVSYCDIGGKDVLISADEGVEISCGTTSTLSLLSSNNTPVTITNVQDPQFSQEAATKKYVDDTNKPPKQAVVAASTINFDMSMSPDNQVLTTNVQGSSLPLIDGVLLVMGERLLLKSQTQANHNGIFAVSSVAVGTWAFTRTPDADVAGKLNSASVNVLQGVMQKGDVYIQTNLMTNFQSNQEWVLSSNQPVYTAGQGISLVGEVITVKNDPATLTFNGTGELQVDTNQDFTWEGEAVFNGNQVQLNTPLLTANVEEIKLGVVGTTTSVLLESDVATIFTTTNLQSAGPAFLVKNDLCKNSSIQNVREAFNNKFREIDFFDTSITTAVNTNVTIATFGIPYSPGKGDIIKITTVSVAVPTDQSSDVSRQIAACMEVSGLFVVEGSNLNLIGSLVQSYFPDPNNAWLVTISPVSVTQVELHAKTPVGTQWRTHITIVNSSAS